MSHNRTTPYPIPAGWHWVKLGNVLSIRNGYAFRSEDYQEEGVLLVRQSNLGTKEVATVGMMLPEHFLDKYPDYVIERGDILVGMSGSVGKLSVYDSTDPALQNQRTGLLQFSDERYKPYVWYFFQTLESKLLTQAKGVAVQNISAGEIENTLLPLPPLPEQNRIVEKIEELFSQLDAGIAALKTAKKQLHRYRQSVLQAAIEGCLTKAWREQQDHLEPADKLLERAEKAEVTNKYKKRGKMTPLDENHTYPLPQCWKWTQIGDIAKNIRYGTSEKASKTASGLPMLRMGDIDGGKLHFDDLKYLPAEKTLKDDLILEPGDVLFNRTNSAELVGKTAVYKSGHPKATYASYLVRAKLYGGIYLPDLLAYYINSVQGRLYINSVISQQVGQANVNASKMSSMPIPVPPFEEQIAIVKEIERLLSVAGDVKKILKRELKRAERLRQSILKEAFSGKLVTPSLSGKATDVVAKQVQEAEAAAHEAAGQLEMPL